MKIFNTQIPLKDFEGKEVKDKGEIVTAGRVIANIIGGQSTNPTLSWVLGKKFSTEKTVELKAEDIVWLKEQINNLAQVPVERGGLSGMVAGQLIALLEEPEVVAKAK